MIRRTLQIGAGLAAIILVLGGVLIISAMSLPSGIVSFEGDRNDIPERVRRIDADSVANRLAEAVRFATVSNDDGSVDAEAFLELHNWLEQTYPSAHAVLDREVINEFSLVYRWPGNAECAAIGFVTHLDVVPVEAGTESEWTYPPFQGVVADGFVWGRGAIDTKSNLIYVMEAIENLAMRRFVPNCDVYLLAGHDEEIGGANGAGATADILRFRNVHFTWLIDEGGGFSGNLDGSIEPMVANVGVAQRGFANIRITASAEGGTSASGIEQTAITRLSRALITIQENPMPGGLDGVAEADLKARAAGGLFFHKLLAGNLSLARPVAESVLRSMGQVNYLRSTMAPTVINGGDKVNILPQQASAIVQVRLHPRDKTSDAVEWIESLLDTEWMFVEVDSFSDPPDPVDPSTSQNYEYLSNVIARTYGPVRTVPYFLASATDGRYYRDLTDALFNFDADSYLPGKASGGGHGTDERLSTELLAEAVLLHELLIESHAPN